MDRKEAAMKQAAFEELREVLAKHKHVFYPLVCPVHDNLETMEFNECGCSAKDHNPVEDAVLVDLVVLMAYVEPSSMDDGAFLRAATESQDYVALGLCNVAAKGYELRR